MNIKNILLLFGLFTLAGAFTIVSCRKKKDTIAIINVLDTSNQPVSGARVILYGQSTLSSQQANVVLYDTVFTNSNGEAVFNFNDVYQLGQAGVAVLDIDVTKGNLTGKGIIKIEEETTSRETVFVQ